MKRSSSILGKSGRAFLEFRHKHESWWEILEAVLVAIVFCLMFVSEAASHWLKSALEVDWKPRTANGSGAQVP